MNAPLAVGTAGTFQFVNCTAITTAATTAVTQTFPAITTAMTNLGTTIGNLHYVLSTAGSLPNVVAFDDVRPPAGFNRYVNASDLLEQFIGWLGDEGVRQGEVMGLPVELFIKWLIVRACEQERSDPGVELVVPRRRQARCYGCQRWMRPTAVPFHDGRCAGLYYARQELAA